MFLQEDDLFHCPESKYTTCGNTAAADATLLFSAGSGGEGGKGGRCGLLKGRGEGGAEAKGRGRG